MKISQDSRKRLIIALTSNENGKEIADIVDFNIDKINELIDAYAALLAKLNADPDLGTEDFGEGDEAPPSKLD